ncbi:hypothetical protein [Jiangella alkaliphila]|uniref:Uncharacterized protein n=1 Tax=Jiangella alkaliphila TaxID=419479 RepID=A0A1H2L817_9ACTN|nr:hypothetical protein [Jiangella alkaliphila]SDU77200.1 hypothetical protein SAMN04488563_5455 [Jiangella alkaliphila]
MSLTIDDRLRDIADAARRSAPDGWQRIVVHAEALADEVEIGLTVTLGDGSTTKKVRPESGLGATVGELRREMYDPGRGGWYLADFTVVGVDVTTTFDYDTCPFGGLIDDDEPDSEADADPEDLLRDHEMYPRPADRLPAWHPAS